MPSSSRFLVTVRPPLFVLFLAFQYSALMTQSRGGGSILVNAQQQTTAHILLYTATADFRHDSIPTAIDALHNQSASAGGKYDVQFDPTEDRTKFTDEHLASYDAIMFVSTTGEVLDDSGKTAFRNYLDKGGNFIAVHAASDSLRNTTWYGQEVGAFFLSHPALQNATINVIDASHPSTSMLPAQWHVQDEMYNFKSDPRSVDAVVVLSPDESTYVDDTGADTEQGTPHPAAWYQERGAGVDPGSNAGRSFYTSLGHLNETWRDDLFLAHVMGGVMWTLQSNTTKVFNSSASVGNDGTGSSGAGTASSTQASSSSTGTSSTSGGESPFNRTSVTILLLAVIAGAVLATIGQAF